MKPIIAMILLSACAAESDLGQIEQHAETRRTCVDIRDGQGNTIGKQCQTCEVLPPPHPPVEICTSEVCDKDEKNCTPGDLGDPGTPTRPVTVAEPEIVFDSFDQHLRVWSVDGTWAEVPGEAMMDGAASRGPADFDGNGLRDLVFESSDGTITSRYAIEGQKLAGLRQWRSKDWRLLSKGRFDADGAEDQLWRSPKGELGIVFGGDELRAQPIDPIKQDWALAALADLDGDGLDEILWKRGGNVVIWTLADGKVAATRKAWIDGASIGAVADFDGDGREDILLRDGKDVTIWWAGIDGKASRSFALDEAFSIEGAHDVDGNGRAELLLKTDKAGVPVRGVKLDVLDAGVSYGPDWTPRL